MGTSGEKKKKQNTPFGREKTLMNHLSKLLPNPLAGFVCSDVRMSISSRVVEVGGGKISAAERGSRASLRPGLTPAGLSAAPHHRFLLALHPQSTGQSHHEPEFPLTSLKELVRQIEHTNRAHK